MTPAPTLTWIDYRDRPVLAAAEQSMVAQAIGVVAEHTRDRPFWFALDGLMVLAFTDKDGPKVYVAKIERVGVTRG